VGGRVGGGVGGGAGGGGGEAVVKNVTRGMTISGGGAPRSSAVLVLCSTAITKPEKCTAGGRRSARSSASRASKYSWVTRWSAASSIARA